jgi:hypothetical protein
VLGGCVGLSAGGHQAELAQCLVGVQPDLLEDVTGAQAGDSGFKEGLLVFFALGPAALPVAAASQHLWW